MYFSTGFRDNCLASIRALSGSFEGSARFDYLSKLADQMIWFLNKEGDVSRTADGSDFFGDHRRKIEHAFSYVPFSIENLEEGHFLSAKYLRELSYGGSSDYNSSDMVLFYLFPEFKEIDYKKVDQIRFGIPITAILHSQTDRLNRIHAIFQKVEEWEISLSQWGVRVKESEDRYQGVIDATNYLGLGNAFDKMLKEKRTERDGLRKNLTWIALATLFVPILFLFLGTTSFIQNFLDEKVTITISSISIFTFSIALEALLLYYFRIVYGQWIIAKNHMLQLYLRHEMCAFVNEYANSAKDMDRTTLAKFENLVFSELSADLNTPPSVYDAVDSIAKVISSLKKP
ncbi:hypothetical protein AO258_01250 [Pseudomonas syringae ICMP 19498]|uniref:hypothetical protein n=1 Tax=Pseudomonas syringae TaxID=317 RepID=UPI000731B1F5|nr:hypothetical protein [Pseudomonas syringae]KTC55245.1 hypothetical protein AO258_01250 [Pseudomonas syringae ICMP 19498]